MEKITTREMEYAIYTEYGLRSKLLTLRINYVPGIIKHECDVLIISKSNYLTEIEIKVSLADLKKDLEKWHKHSNNKIKYQYFAIPEYLKKHIDLIPENFGIIIVDKIEACSTFGRKTPLFHTHYRVREFKKAPVNPLFCKFKLSDEELLNLYRIHSYKFRNSLKRELKRDNLYIEGN